MTTIEKVLLCAAALLPAGAAYAADDACAASGGLQFVCGPKNAEDLVAGPGTKWRLASGMTDGAALTSGDTRDGAYRVASPGPNPRAAHDAKYPDCTTPPAAATFITHGLNLRAGSGGHSTLYAVTHGARESIEAFDV